MLGDGFLVVPRKRGSFAHELCGPHKIVGAWCPNCKKPLLRLLTLDCADTNLAELRAEGLSVVHLLVCWTCRLAQKPLYYKQERYDVTLLKWGKGGACTDFPYAAYPIAFPVALVSLVRIGGREADAMARVVQGDVRPYHLPRAQQWLGLPKHQVGGFPVGIHPSSRPKCCKCKASMSPLAAICDTASDGLVFAGNYFVQVVFWLCRRDWILLAQQISD